MAQRVLLPAPFLSPMCTPPSVLNALDLLLSPECLFATLRPQCLTGRGSSDVNFASQYSHRFRIQDGDAPVTKFDPSVTLEVAEDCTDGLAVGAQRIGQNLVAYSHLVTFLVDALPE